MSETGEGVSGLLGPNDVRELAAMLGVTPTKKLGQNFVHDPNTVRKIVRLAGVSEEDRVLEIGPGLGSLTLGILETGAHVTAVEIDERLAGQLTLTAESKQPNSKLYVVHADALELSPSHLKQGEDSPPNVLVANLPYNVSVPILMHLLELVPELDRGLVMVQAEVGMRIAAGPGSKEYGVPSVKAAWYGEWEFASKVSRQIFWPVPGVDSVLISYKKYFEPIGSETERQLTFKLITHAFAGRRKMLRQSLQTVIGAASSEEAAKILQQAGADPTARAENLSILHYLAIAKHLLSNNS